MPRILDKVGHFGPDICTTWHSFSMWNESFFLPWAKNSIRHTNHLCTSYLSSGCQGMLWMCLTAGIFAI